MKAEYYIKIKKRSLILLLLFLPLMLNAQDFWSRVVDDKPYNKSHLASGTLFRDSLILAGGTVSDVSCPRQVLFAFDLRGKRLWNIEGYFDLLFTDSGYIYTAGYEEGDDVCCYEEVVIAKYDGEGHKIFSTGYPGVPHNDIYFFEPRSMDIAADGTILVCSGESVLKSDIHGAAIRSWQLSLFSEAEQIIAVTPRTCLLCSQDRIYRTDSSFSVTDSLLLPDSLTKTLLIRDTLYALSGGQLLRLDTALTIIDTLISSTSDDYTDLVAYDGGLLVRTGRSDSLELIRIAENHAADTLVFGKYGHIRRYLHTGDNFTFLGESFSGQICLYNYHLPGEKMPEPRFPDIELVDFDIDSITFRYQQAGDDSVLVGYDFNTELILRNNGPDTLHSFAVYAYLHGEMFCMHNYFYQKFSGMEVAPGASVTVHLNRAFEEGKNGHLCFECLAPDSRPELETRNNKLCKTFDITARQDLHTSSVRVYPNPATGYLIIESREPRLRSIVLTDMSGRVLLRSQITGERTRLNTFSLAPGTYILKLFTGHGAEMHVIVIR